MSCISSRNTQHVLLGQKKLAEKMYKLRQKILQQKCVNSENVMNCLKLPEIWHEKISCLNTKNTRF